MPVRLFTISIGLFWIASVAWLCAVIWAPPGSRMTKIDPREVYRVFFEWNDSTSMTLLENGMRRGEVSVSGGSGIEGESGKFERVLSLSGSLEDYDESSASSLVNLFWKGTLAFTETMESRGGEFSVRIPGKELSIHLSFEGPNPEGGKPTMRARVTMAGNEIFAFDPSAMGSMGGADLQKNLPMLGPLATIAGLGPFDPANLKLTTEARTGSFNLGGREMRAFLLTLRGADPGQEVRIYLSEAGEPLRIETDLGFEAISEILVPLDAYKRRPSAK